MDDKEIFQPHYSNLKALVSVCGRDLKKEPYLLSKFNLNEQQIRRLSEILDNKKHPWMIDYYTRASFVETNPETSQIKGPREIILITIPVIFTCYLLVGIYTALRDEFDVTMVDYAKFILGLGTYLCVGLLIRKLPNYFLWITTFIGYAILIIEYPDLDFFIIIAPPVTLWALGDLLLSVII